VTGQLAFDLPADPALRRADFFASPANAPALAAVDGWRNWPGARMLLVGPCGAGKTHLAHIWADDAQAQIMQAQTLPDCDLRDLTNRPLCLEDAAAVAGTPAAETALFHLCNLMAETRAPLLLTARHAPRDWGLHLPDLASRLEATPQTRLDPPDDALLSAVLVKLFADRQIAVPPNLIPFLVTRMDRSIDAARMLVAALDSRALALHRPVTRQFAAELLDSQGEVPE
jgi:chromosomal replication initiation ATPase DnaA